MAFSLEIRRRAQMAAGPFLGAATVVYFIFHMVQGERGLIAWWHLRQDISKAESVLQTVEAEKADLQHRVSLLQPSHLDPDLLDERARVMLDQLRTDERIIPQGNSRAALDQEGEGE